MRLTLDNATAVSELLTDVINDAGQEVLNAAEGYADLDGENTAEAREERAEHREEWDGNIDGLEALLVELVELFGYVAVPKAKARKAGLA